ncbi:hypothetical protein [Halalkalicoccus jeotgali]|uniref:Rpa-associated protein n=1 Tax=Halalkalicoccus jeotgali (strain DSM 18796 / CECT 7217 / JCM 14584 / KCTC 4019 / B3) TaxID=795797 RepID=D8J3G0_HALJB|nr:hypothetical protein [Halalkalicoccus jeotgali]ADJ15267.1 hypothetical protein HacjB3_09420 [Halalkalicoccus jeotgali B3]ELY35312.1 hypothetical protein C497_13256 [Halalkalicoccus jeotgali B3]
MSSNQNGGASSGDSGPGTREIAHRLFACEFDAASLEYADSDEERAPKYVITPSGARVNRLFVVGVLTEVERVNEEVVRARVVDPTGAFVVYAGQYQPDALAFLERADPPMFVAVTGKANTFQPEDSDRVYTSVRPESIAEVDAETRDRWTVQAAEHTLGRVGEFARVLDGGESDPTSGVGLAREEYATTPAYLSALRDTALDTARLVAGEAEEVTPPGITPGEDDGRAVILGELWDATVAGSDTGEAEETAETSEPSEPSPVAEPTTADAEEEPETELDSESEPDTGAVEAAEGGEGEPTETPSETSETGVDGTGTADATGASPSETEEPSDRLDVEDSETSGTDQADDEPTEAAADENELYEFDAEERAEIESEFDMDFSSGNEVDDPGEADIEVPEPDGPSDETTDVTEPAGQTDTEGVADSGTEPTSGVDETTGDESPDEDVDVEDRAMAVMKELADGDGADREQVIERVANEAGVGPETVDEAIDSALLSGRCYEPQDDVLKPI